MKRYFEKIYKGTFASFMQDIETKVANEEQTFVITANPETLMIGQENANFDAVLKSDQTLIVPDGVGVLKAIKLLGYDAKERVTGVEIVQRLLEILNEQKRSLYLLGAKEEVLQQFVAKVRSEYPQIELCGYQNGYVEDKDAVFDHMVGCHPDVVLVALGIPHQELLIAKHYDRFDKGIFIGVGGSLDVLSGMKKRAPQIFIKLNLEWLYRITSEPKRMKRFYRSNIKFIRKIAKMRRKNHD